MKVPNVVPYRTFWLRYFYKLHKWKEVGGLVFEEFDDSLLDACISKVPSLLLIRMCVFTVA